jgi:hypothetical protein
LIAAAFSNAERVASVLVRTASGMKTSVRGLTIFFGTLCSICPTPQTHTHTHKDVKHSSVLDKRGEESRMKIVGAGEGERAVKAELTHTDK